MIKIKNKFAELTPNEVLETRGFIGKKNHSIRALPLIDLNDENACIRSISARQLAKSITDNSVITALIHRLTIEKALYTKIEICNSLSAGNINCTKKLIPFLATIKNNQYEKLPSRISKKKSFPLPRDIVARTIGKMDADCLPTLLAFLPQCHLIQARELIDAIGYLIFSRRLNDASIFETLNHYQMASEDEVILWKLSIVYGFLKPHSDEALQILTQNNSSLIAEEAEKALLKSC